MTNRYQLCKERVEGIMSRINSTIIFNHCSMISRVKTVKVIKKWFKDMNESDKKKAINLVNRYGLGRQVQALTDCILMQVYAIDCIDDEEIKMQQLKALGDRIYNSMIKNFIMCITEEDIRYLVLNVGMINNYQKTQKSEPKVKYQKPVILKNPVGMEWNGIACVHDSIRNSKTIQVLLEITDQGPRIVSYKK